MASAGQIRYRKSRAVVQVDGRSVVGQLVPRDFESNLLKERPK